MARTRGSRAMTGGDVRFIESPDPLRALRSGSPGAAAREALRPFFVQTVLDRDEVEEPPPSQRTGCVGGCSPWYVLLEASPVPQTREAGERIAVEVVVPRRPFRAPRQCLPVRGEA